MKKSISHLAELIQLNSTQFRINKLTQVVEWVIPNNYTRVALSDILLDTEFDDFITNHISSKDQ